MGWYTVNPQFAERLERHAETATQGPSGFAQAMVTALLLEWHYTGYIRWLRGQYILSFLLTSGVLTGEYRAAIAVCSTS